MKLLWILPLLVACSGKSNDDTSPSSDDSTATNTDDSNGGGTTTSDVNPVILSVDLLQCSTQQSAEDVWQMNLTVDDPQGATTVRSGTVDVMLQERVLATYQLACNGGLCTGSFRSTYDGIGCDKDSATESDADRYERPRGAEGDEEEPKETEVGKPEEVRREEPNPFDNLERGDQLRARLEAAPKPAPAPKAPAKPAKKVVPELVKPTVKGVTKDGIAYTKDFDAKFLTSQRELLLLSLCSQLSPRALQLPQLGRGLSSSLECLRQESQ